MNQILCAAAAPAINAALYWSARKYAGDSAPPRRLDCPAMGVLAAGTAIECLVVILRHSVPPEALFALCAAVVSAATDVASGYVLDVVTLPAASFSIGASAFHGGLPFSVAGAGVCGGLLYLLYVLTRRRGIGLGDVKLAACVGAGLGVSNGAAAAGVAFISGGCWAAVLLLRGAPRGSEMRFAPYIAAGALTCAAWGISA